MLLHPWSIFIMVSVHPLFIVTSSQAIFSWTMKWLPTSETLAWSNSYRRASWTPMQINQAQSELEEPSVMLLQNMVWETSHQHGDVYSFGILMLEIFTGRRPTDNVFGEGSSLHDFVKAALPDHVMEVVDQTLVVDIVGEDMNTSEGAWNFRRNGNIDMMLEALVSILEIAISCSAQLPQDRLDMANVAAKLSSIRSKLIQARSRPQRKIIQGN